MSSDADFDPIEYLVSQKYELMRPGRARIDRVGNWSSIEEKKQQAEAWVEYVNRANEYRLELAAKSQADLEAMVSAIRADRQERYRQEQIERERCHWSNSVRAMATESTYDYWSKAAYWTCAEAIALLLGRKPNFLTPKKLEEDGTGYFELRRAYHAIEELVKRAVEFNVLDDKNTPDNFIKWAQNNRIFVPPELLSALNKKDIEPGALENKYNEIIIEVESLRLENEALRDKLGTIDADNRQEVALNPRERESLLKIVIAVAVRKYQYKPENARNSAASNIMTALHEIGLSLDEDTIRKYLNEGRELLLQSN